MDRTDERILDLLRENGRMTYRELGEAVGMSRVAVKKRVRKLQTEGILRRFCAYECRPGEVMLLIEIVTKPGYYGRVLDFVARQDAVRRVCSTTMKNHIHAEAVSDSVPDLRHLIRMIQEECGRDLQKIQTHAVREIIRDDFGGIRYEPDESGNRQNPGIRKRNRPDAGNSENAEIDGRKSSGSGDHGTCCESDTGTSSEREARGKVPFPDVHDTGDEYCSAGGPGTGRTIL